MKSSLYSLKSRFQALLTPTRDYLIQKGFSPNQITLFTCGLCIVYAVLITWTPTTKVALIFLPLLLFVRMALNALDGMIARHTEQGSDWGMVLNELCDVIADLALFSSFLAVLSTGHTLWLVLILLGVLTEFVSLALLQISTSRPNHGPFGKSDRALFLAIFSVLLIVANNTTLIIGVISIGIMLSLLTIVNRLKSLHA